MSEPLALRGGKPKRPALFTIRRAWRVEPTGEFVEWFGNKRAPLLRDEVGQPYRRMDEIVGAAWTGVKYCTLHAECREHLALGRECALNNPTRYLVRLFVSPGYWNRMGGGIDRPTAGRVLYYFGELTAERPAYPSQEAFRRAHPPEKPKPAVWPPWSSATQTGAGDVVLARQVLFDLGVVVVPAGQTLTLERDLPMHTAEIGPPVFSQDESRFFVVEHFQVVGNDNRITEIFGPVPADLFRGAQVSVRRPGPPFLGGRVSVTVRNTDHLPHTLRMALTATEDVAARARVASGETL